MPSEAARHDLYTGLVELLGPQRAETFMAAFPGYEIPELVTKDEFRAGLAELRADLRGEIHQGLAAVNQRIDRLFLALMGGFVVLLGAVVGVAFLN